MIHRAISKMDKGFFMIELHFVARHPASSIKYHNTISLHNYHQHNIFNVPKNNVLWVKVENYTVKDNEEPCVQVVLPQSVRVRYVVSSYWNTQVCNEPLLA